MPTCPNCNNKFDDPMGDVVGKIGATIGIFLLGVVVLLVLLRFVILPLGRGLF